MGPSSGRLAPPKGRGHVLEELLPPIPAKKFSSSRDTLSGGQQSLCLPTEGLYPFFGMFLHQHFSPGLHLCSFCGVQCFSPLLPFPPPGTFKPPVTLALVLEHALCFSSHTPAPNDPSTSSCPNHCTGTNHFQEVSRHCTSHPYPCLFLPLPLV